MKTLLSVLFLLLSPVVLAIDEWRTPENDNLIYMQLDSGTVIIELAPFMAPKHVEQFKALVKEGFYDDLDFYRVIDGFVAQGGDVSEQKTSQHNHTLKAEFSRPAPQNTSFLPVQKPDFMAPETGFLAGFAAGRDPASKQEWLLHCPGTLAMARSNEANSASSDFYIVIGQATRHLDRNMSSFGRVIYGMPAIQALQRADINNASGVIDEPSKRSKIKWIKLASDVPANARLNVQVQNEKSEAVSQRLASARTLDSEFFHFKGNGNLDVCYYQLKSRLLSQ
ncbi:peptidylprolyl isomerase [Paraglaciecola hydrolytica]|uniref:peptidylprolyl isomerase n=1 Tax=Paraglaciecola hydrolytica TaxID=1799789 RepID=UPI0008398260|nr:peptidylprolyl isomerase [Paraglaciecola hydrolytica]